MACEADGSISIARVGECVGDANALKELKAGTYATADAILVLRIVDSRFVSINGPHRSLERTRCIGEGRNGNAVIVRSSSHVTAMDSAGKLSAAAVAIHHECSDLRAMRQVKTGIKANPSGILDAS